MNNTIIKILNKLDLLRWINIHGYLRLNNKEFTIPILGKTGHANLFMSEPWMTDLLKIILPIENKTFIDVGVNVGQSLLKLKSISAEINYIGFEPNPICIHYLTKLMKAMLPIIAGSGQQTLLMTMWKIMQRLWRWCGRRLDVLA